MTISSLPVNEPDPKDQGLGTQNESTQSAVSDEPSPSEQLPNSETLEQSPAQTAPSLSEALQNSIQTVQSLTPTPEPTPQNVPPAQVAELSVYDQITQQLLGRMGQPTARTNMKMLIYGPPGGTKSSFLSQIPDLFSYDMEDGLISMATQEHYTGKPKHPHQLTMPFSSFAEADLLVERFVDNIPELQEWKVFGIDTFSTFYKKALQEIAAVRYGIRPTANRYRNEDDDYKEANPRTMAFIDNLSLMRRDLVLLAHERTVEPKNKPARTFPDFSEGLSQKIEALMDIVGHMQMMELEGYAEPVPVLRVISDGTVHAKTRVPLPAVIVNPDWNDLKQTWIEWQEKVQANQA